MTDSPSGPESREKLLLIEEEMKDSYLSYAMSVIVSRALPDARDGLKPSQRRVLVAMNDLNLGPRSRFRKCAKIAGDTSGNYHPHGEAVVYPTLVRMAQPFNTRYPLVDGQGNFGSIDGDPPAAMRYTEARMTAAAAAMMEDLDKETVDFIPNYEGSRVEPTVLPSLFPNLLVNGSAGIAVGMATSIPPHNLREMCDGLTALIDDPGLGVDELLEIVRGPDFPTGGILCGLQGVREAYRTGRGLVTVRGRVHVEDVKKERQSIVITEIPYQVNKAALIAKIAELVKEDRIDGIADIRDESDKDGMRIVIDLKRGEEPDVVLNQLYKFTQLQDTFSIINIALVGARPLTLPLRDLMAVYLDHRREIIRRRTAFLLDKALQRQHVLEGYRIALDHIDAVIETIRASADVPEARAALVQHFGLSEVQSDAILQMRLQRLTGLEREKIEEEYRQVTEDIAYYRSVLGDPALVNAIIREDLKKVREEYGDARRSEIGEPIVEIEVEDLITDEEMAITLSHEGYIKRTPIAVYKQQKRGGVGVSGSSAREGDFVEELFTAMTKDFLLCFTDRGRVHWLKVHQIPELSRQSRGRSIVNLLQLEPGEKVTSIIPVRDFSTGDLLMATRSGAVKRTALSAFSRPKRTGIIAIGLEERDLLVGVLAVTDKDEVLLATRKGKAIRFPVKQVRRMGRPAHGVRGIRLRGGDELIGVVRVDPSVTILTACELGLGKRTVVEEYRLQSRGGMGVINIRCTSRNGEVVGVLSVQEGDDVILITSNGMVVRTPVGPISAIGRNTQGVKLISLREEDRLVSIAHVVKDDENGNGGRGREEARSEVPMEAGARGPDDVPGELGDDDLEGTEPSLDDDPNDEPGAPGTP
ncbi:MAG: DNA gyrase subunit A [Planctomycetota bacterium]